MSFVLSNRNLSRLKLFNHALLLSTTNRCFARSGSKGGPGPAWCRGTILSLRSRCLRKTRKYCESYPLSARSVLVNRYWYDRCKLLQVSRATVRSWTFPGAVTTLNGKPVLSTIQESLTPTRWYFPEYPVISRNEKLGINVPSRLNKPIPSNAPVWSTCTNRCHRGLNPCCVCQNLSRLQCVTPLPDPLLSTSRHRHPERRTSKIPGNRTSFGYAGRPVWQCGWGRWVAKKISCVSDTTSLWYLRGRVDHLLS